MQECTCRPYGWVFTIKEGDYMKKVNENVSFWLKSVCVLLAGALVAPSVIAADEEQEEQKYMEEIIVTAEKRQENILDVPVTMSAFSAKAIEELGMSADEDLEKMVPGLQFGYDSEGYGIAMRGVGTQVAVQTTADQAVAFYVDGVYSYKPYGTAPNMFDLERIEVARGPQGTLNGKNSIAGSVSYVSQRPTDEFDLNVLVEYTDQFTQRYGVAFGGPLAGDFSYRITSSYYEGDGIQENVGIGGDYGAPDQWMIAPQLRYTTDRLDVNLRYSYLEDSGSARSRIGITEKERDSATILFFGFWEQPNDWFLYDKPVSSVEGCPPGQFSEFGGICNDLKQKVLSNRTNQQENDAERWSFNLDFDVTENLTLRYTYGENESHTFGSQDRDGTDRVPSAQDPSVPADIIDDPALVARWKDEGGKFRDLEDAWLEDDIESSHELQIFSNFDGPFNFVAGLYTYENESSWRDRQHDWANPLFTTDTEQAATHVDLNRDGVADWTSCEDFRTTFLLVEDDEETEEVEGFGESGDEWTHCPAGSDHLWESGGGAGSSVETEAIFVNVEYRFNEHWQVSGGLRWTEDTKSTLTSISGDHGVFGQLDEVEDDQLLPGAPDPWGGIPVYGQFIIDPNKDSWEATIGHVSLEYTSDAGHLYYGRISTGFRAGGFNQVEDEDTVELIRLGAIAASFPGSELVNYEVGIKGLFLENRLMLTAGAFLQDYDKYHLKATQFIGAGSLGNRESPFTDYTDAFDGTKIKGIEVEATFFLSDNLRLSGFYNWLDSSIGPHSAQFQDDRDTPRETFIHTWIDQSTGTMMSEELEKLRDVTGNTLPQQPQHKAALTLQYSRPLRQWGTLTALTTWSYTGERWADIGNVPYAVVPDFDRWDVRASWESPTRTWDVTVYVQNVADEIGIQEWASQSNVWLTEHRQLGLQVRFRPEF